MAEEEEDAFWGGLAVCFKREKSEEEEATLKKHEQMLQNVNTKGKAQIIHRLIQADKKIHRLILRFIIKLTFIKYLTADIGDNITIQIQRMYLQMFSDILPCWMRKSVELHPASLFCADPH